QRRGRTRLYLLLRPCAHRFGRTLLGIAFQAHTITLKIDQAEDGLARLQVVAMARAQHKKTVAIGLFLDAGALCGDKAHPLLVFDPGDDVADFLVGILGLLREEHPLPPIGLDELPRRYLGQVGTLLVVLSVLADLSIRPWRRHERQYGNDD